ncbi:MAG: 50S ribosomal protein L32 [bacterium]|nr:50S ribosomal protein L32 [bacterium]
MPVPARKQTSSHGKRRRSHLALKRGNLATCAKCAKPVFPHRACTTCGTYRGRTVLSIVPRVRKSSKETRTGKKK